MEKPVSALEWKRARSPEQKRQRRAQILAAAAELYGQHGFEGVSLNSIARNAGLAKSNLYRYFSGREEIFLGLVADDYAEYVDALGDRLGALAGTGDTGDARHSRNTRPELTATSSTTTGRQIAAGIVVGKLGAETADPDEIRKELAREGI